MQHVYIVGSKSIGQYGGYETFVDKLTEYHQNNLNIKYHIACKSNGQGSMDESKLKGATKLSDSEFEYHNAHCFKMHVPQVGAAQAIYYDIIALQFCCEHIVKNHIKEPIIYVLACRIGPFIRIFAKRIHRFGGRLYVNPDGHEWKRAKWNMLIRRYWKLSEQLMIKHADLIICDSKNIERYIKKEYIRFRPKTAYIAYGADLQPSILMDDNPQYTAWLKRHKLVPGDFFVLCGRFVRENNFETIINEFMRSDTTKDLVLITNVEKSFLNEIQEKTHYRQDPRIKFVGTVYDHELLKKIRENAYGYFHGHEVGGTNPSLLEALASTKLNLLLNVGFNTEVAKDAAIYWEKDVGNLADIINKVDNFSEEVINSLGKKARQRIVDFYNWDLIADQYEGVFYIKSQIG